MVKEREKKCVWIWKWKRCATSKRRWQRLVHSRIRKQKKREKREDERGRVVYLRFLLGLSNFELDIGVHRHCRPRQVRDQRLDVEWTFLLFPCCSCLLSAAPDIMLCACASHSLLQAKYKATLLSPPFLNQQVYRHALPWAILAPRSHPQRQGDWAHARTKLVGIPMTWCEGP